MDAGKPLSLLPLLFLSLFPPLILGFPLSRRKSTVGLALAQQLAIPFVDGDDLHPAANVAKMSEGNPLTDEVSSASSSSLISRVYVASVLTGTSEREYRIVFHGYIEFEKMRSSSPLTKVYQLSILPHQDRQPPPTSPLPSLPNSPSLSRESNPPRWPRGTKRKSLVKRDDERESSSRVRR